MHTCIIELPVGGEIIHDVIAKTNSPGSTVTLVVAMIDS